MVLGKLMKLFNDENRMAALLRNVEVQDSSDVERIAAKLSVSTKTVRNDVKELNCLCEQIPVAVGMQQVRAFAGVEIGRAHV